MCVCVCVSHSHSGAVHRVVLFESAGLGLEFVLHQVEQRFTHVLLVDVGVGISHGEDFHHVGRDPGVEGASLQLVTLKTHTASLTLKLNI